MVRIDNQESQTPLITLNNDEVLRRFEREIIKGKHWYLALLEATEMWDTAEEKDGGRVYRYLIAGEAFDWLLLAERLCGAVDKLLLDDEKTSLLFHGKPPICLTSDDFKDLIGETKYRQYLNYFYGVTVEEALIVAVEDEVLKERWASGYHREKDTTNEAFKRIYGATHTIQLRRFRKAKDYPQLKSINLDELREYTYWLFKFRLKQSDKAKVASDTKKALDWLDGKGYSQRPDAQTIEMNNISLTSGEPHD